MRACGLVSVSFRDKTPAQIVDAAHACGLACIEWGSDVHAPADDPARCAAIAALCAAHGIRVSSYGTYFRIGRDAPRDFAPYLDAAAALGTKILRLWCGTKGYAAYTADELGCLFADCRKIEKMAAAAEVTVCMECHGGTVTDCAEGAKVLMDAAGSAHFRMYWQPNQFRTVAENLRYAAFCAPYTEIVHVFNWQGKAKYPLRGAADIWRQYLACFPARVPLLLEFMPDDRIESLANEAAALREIAALAGSGAGEG